MGFMAVILALLGYEVHAVCYSQYLSQRDYESFKDLFTFFQVQYQITYGTFNEVSELILQKKIDLRKVACSLVDKQFVP